MISEKRLIALFSVLIVIFLNISLVSALSIQELVESLWVNAALVFLLLFNIILFAVKNLFKKSYGAAVIISIIISLMCTVGLIASFGSFFSKIGLWLIVLVILAIALLSLRFAKGKSVVIFIILGIAALAWLAFFHNNLCPPQGTLSEDACQVIDVIALIIVVVLFFRFLFWLLGKFKGGVGGSGNSVGGSRGPKPNKPGKPGQPNKPGKPDKEDKVDDGTLVGNVVDQNGKPIEGVSISLTKRDFVSRTVPTDKNGNYGINLPGGRNFVQAWGKYRYKITAHKSGYSPRVRYVGIMSNRIRTRNFVLKNGGSDVPIIKQFVAAPPNVSKSGDKTTLHWVCDNTVGVRIFSIGKMIHQQSGPNGQIPVQVNSNTNQVAYELRAFSASGKHVDEHVIVHISSPQSNGKKLVVEMYVNGAVNRNAGEIQIKPNVYSNVKTSSIPFHVKKENPGFKFKKWMIHHVTKQYTEPPRTGKNFLLSMDGDCKVEAHFSSTNANQQSNMGKISLSVSRKQVKSGKSTHAYASWSGGKAPFKVNWHCPSPLQTPSQPTNKSPVSHNFTIQGNPGQIIPIHVRVEDANGVADTALKNVRVIP